MSANVHEKGCHCPSCQPVSGGFWNMEDAVHYIEDRIDGTSARIASLEAFAEAVREARCVYSLVLNIMDAGPYLAYEIGAALAKLDAAKKEGE